LADLVFPGDDAVFRGRGAPGVPRLRPGAALPADWAVSAIGDLLSSGGRRRIATTLTDHH
jgi:hypothetical protein